MNNKINYKNQLLNSQKDIFSDRLNLKLTEMNISQSDLARMCNINRQVISNYINKVSLPREITLKKIASILKVDSNWLIGVTEVFMGDELHESDYKNILKRIITTNMTNMSNGINTEIDFISNEYLQGVQNIVLKLFELNMYGISKVNSYINDIYVNHRNQGITKNHYKLTRSIPDYPRSYFTNNSYQPSIKNDKNYKKK